MAQSLAKNLVHLIYGTKGRRPYLNPRIRPRLFGYQAGTFQDLDCPVVVIGGDIDHVHALFALSKNCRLSDVVEQVKKSSSKWMKTQGDAFWDFHWQSGYGAFSVSQSNAARVRRYIEDQPEHHKKLSFQDEFRLFLKRYGVEYDEQYVWD